MSLFDNNFRFENDFYNIFEGKLLITFLTTFHSSSIFQLYFWLHDCFKISDYQGATVVAQSIDGLISCRKTNIIKAFDKKVCYCKHFWYRILGFEI